MYAYICILIIVLDIFYLDKRFVLCASFFFPLYVSSLTQIFCIVGRFFTIWATAHKKINKSQPGWKPEGNIYNKTVRL